MLNDFLVLGQIPGTGFIITFNELLIVFVIAALAGAGYLGYKRNWPERFLAYARPRAIRFIESRKRRQLSLPL